jgi:hypothetical protein
LVRVLPPDDELRDLPLDELALVRDRLVDPDEPLRLRLLLPLLLPLDRLEAERLLLERFAAELLLPLDRFDPELLPLLDRFDAELPRRVACEDRLRAELPDFRPVCPEPWPSPPPSFCWSSSPLPRSFFATPTAAGTATPAATPATTFLPVDIPSFSLSLSILPPFLACRVSSRCSRY